MGCKRAAMVITIVYEYVSMSEYIKNYLSSDCILKLKYMKLEPLVIGYKYGSVNGKGPLHTPPVTPWKFIIFEIY